MQIASQPEDDERPVPAELGWVQPLSMIPAAKAPTTIDDLNQFIVLSL